MGNTLGAKIRAARKAKGLTQLELAGLVGAKNTAVSNWENDLNKPDIDTVEKLCGVLDIKPGQLIGMNNYLSQKLLATVAEGERMREFLSEDEYNLIVDYRYSSLDDRKLILRTASNAALAASAAQGRESEREREAEALTQALIEQFGSQEDSQEAEQG